MGWPVLTLHGYIMENHWMLYHIMENLQGLKTHDCHILLQRIIPAAIRGIMDKDIYEALAELGNFFQQLCAKTLKLDVLERLKADIPIILCKLEKIFPPSFFDVMLHLAVHLPEEAILRGPVQYGWMYPVERRLLTLKRFVRNMARPERSIAEAYVAAECLNICSRYFGDDVETRHNREGRNRERVPCMEEGELSVFQHGAYVFGAPNLTYLDHDYEKMVWFVLNNCPEVESYIEGLKDKIPVHISEGKLRPEVPLQAAKLASEAGIILRDHIPIFTHWKQYKKEDTKPIVKNFNDKLGSQFIINQEAVPVKEAFSDLLRRGQRQMRYKLKKTYFDGIPTNEVRTTSPVSTMTDMEWKQLVDMWSSPKHKKQTKFKDAPPTAIDIFKNTHCSSKSGFTEQAKDAIAQMEAYVAEPTEEGQDPKTVVEAVAHVLQKSTFLRNVGMQSAVMKRNSKVAAMNARVTELESELHAEKAGSAGLRSQLADVQKELEDQKEIARKNMEETEKLKQQGIEIQGFLGTMFGNKFA